MLQSEAMKKPLAIPRPLKDEELPLLEALHDLHEPGKEAPGLLLEGEEEGCRVRVYRMPADDLSAVMDKSEGFSGCGGPLFAETCAACYDLPQRPMLIDVVYGLAGRDCRVEDIERVYRHLLTMAETGVTGPRYLHMGQRSNAEEVL